MQTDEFEESLDSLIDRARNDRTALMCAEAVPWPCHRSLIADALGVRGIRVEHILSGVRTQTHNLTPWARVRGKRITYPATEAVSAEKVGGSLVQVDASKRKEKTHYCSGFLQRATASVPADNKTGRLVRMNARPVDPKLPSNPRHTSGLARLRIVRFVVYHVSIAKVSWCFAARCRAIS